MRITVPNDQVAVLMPIELAQELYHLCVTIRKAKRLKIDEPMHKVAGDVMLAVLASEEILVLPKGREGESA